MRRIAKLVSHPRQRSKSCRPLVLSTSYNAAPIVWGDGGKAAGTLPCRRLCCLGDKPHVLLHGTARLTSTKSVSEAIRFF